jgi:hypothetical protein
MMDVEWWMMDSFRIQNCSFKISQPVRSVRFQEIMGCFNFGFWMLNDGLKTMLDFGFWMEFSIQHLDLKFYLGVRDFRRWF